MGDRLYSAAEAAQDLAAAGLLSGMLGPGAADFPSGAAGGFAGATLDSRLLKERELFIALPGERVDGRKFIPEVLARGHWVLTDVVPDLASKDTPEGAGLLLSNDPVAALNHLARCWRQRRNPLVVGVTGTNGKTTTKDFIAALLGAAGPVLATTGNFNNCLGLPVTVLGLRPEHSFAVIEMGASAQGEIKPLAEVAGPSIGVITNASPAHLAEFGSLDGIIAGKGELLDVLPKDGFAVLNADSPGFGRWSDRAPCRVKSFGLTGGDNRWSWFPGGTDPEKESGPVLEFGGKSWPVPLPGRHNGANLAAAILVARAAGLKDKKIAEGLRNFRGSAHRGVLLDIGGRKILDDCYNANPTSMVAAAEALAGVPGPGRLIAVLGHMGELGSHSREFHVETGRCLAAGPVEVLVTVGEQTESMAEGFKQGGQKAHSCATIAEAADWLADNTKEGDRILVKGSRSAGLEELLNEMSVRFGKGQGD
ncbi:MAG: UDP-N-acetylmuramoyl-tripeptide--D-alanyl-D-alanine ligase [Gemmatimonadales bacterium]|nr:UDP-N-acetylmuramoyl-tripeptide--D-alanyl-D-alanine ligase [Gemmatimonadales bacterium]